MRDIKEYTVLDSVTPVAITSSTDATPIVVTATSHGLSTGDIALIYGHTTNIAANGTYKVTRLTADTFSLQNLNTGANIAGTGGGAGAGGFVCAAPKIVFGSDFRTIVLQVSTAGTATTTLKVAGTLSTTVDTVPNFGATVSASNPYAFLQIIDLDTGSAINGATGIVVAGTDINKQYEINVNSEKYVTVFPTSWTAGAISIKALVTDNG